MTAILITLNVVAGLFLIAVVLLQTGKGAEMGAAFGGASSAVFGPTGATTILTKITAVTAAVFMGTSLALAVLSAERPSVMDEVTEPEPPVAAVPAAPAEEQAAAEQTQQTAEQKPAEAPLDLGNVVKQAAQQALDQAAAGGAAVAEPAGGQREPAAGGTAETPGETPQSAAPGAGGVPVDAGSQQP
ncbi:MAG: preprotein translocase subunit SecG [Candidatus Dadabacteria bacterium]|nr:MAG: preprotein translocase subunit SecG [Candidatus Dadabacteria bacterium]